MITPNMRPTVLWLQHAPTSLTSEITANQNINSLGHDASHSAPLISNKTLLLKNHVDALSKWLKTLEQLSISSSSKELSPLSSSVLALYLKESIQKKTFCSSAEWTECSLTLSSLLNKIFKILQEQAEETLPNITDIWKSSSYSACACWSPDDSTITDSTIDRAQTSLESTMFRPSTSLNKENLNHCFAGQNGSELVQRYTENPQKQEQLIKLDSMCSLLVNDYSEIIAKVIHNIGWIQPSTRINVQQLFLLLLYIPKIIINKNDIHNTNEISFQPSLLLMKMISLPDLLDILVENVMSDSSVASFSCTLLLKIFIFIFEHYELISRFCDMDLCVQADKRFIDVFITQTPVIKNFLYAMGIQNTLDTRWAACATLRYLFLTGNYPMFSSVNIVTETFLKNFEALVCIINGPQLLNNDDAFVKIPIMKLLFDVFTDRHLVRVMKLYVTHAQCLHTILRNFINAPTSVALEAFHLLKLFVMNPNQTPDVSRTLSRRRHEILFVLSQLGRRIPDEEFTVDRKIVMERLQHLGLKKS